MRVPFLENTGQASLTSATLPKLTGRGGASKSQTSSAAVFRAKTFPRQGKGRASKKAPVADSGSSSTRPYAHYDRSTHSWRMYQRSLFGGFVQSSETLPKSGTMRNGSLFALPTWERRTDASDSLSLPTPVVSDAWTPNLKSSQIKEGSRHSMTLPKALMLPTPVVADATTGRIIGKTTEFVKLKGGNFRKYNQTGTDGSIGLSRTLMLTLPTPGATEYKGSPKSRFAGSPNSKRSRTSEALRTSREDPTYLNPSFAEAIMGFPVGWTELSASEMPSSPRSRRSSVKRL